MYNLKQKLITMTGVAGIVALGYAPAHSMEMQKLQELGKMPGIEKMLLTYEFINGNLSSIVNEKVFKDKTIIDVDETVFVDEAVVPDGKTDSQYIYKFQKDGKLRLEEKKEFSYRNYQGNEEQHITYIEKWRYEIKDNGTVWGYGDTGDNGSIDKYIIERPDGTKDEIFNYGALDEWKIRHKTLPDGAVESTIIKQDGSKGRTWVIHIKNDRVKYTYKNPDGEEQSHERLIKTLNLPDGKTVIEEETGNNTRIIRTTFEINF